MELTKEIWTQSDYDEFAEYLKTLADEKYKKFSEVVGKEFTIDNIKVIPIYHPSPISPLSLKGNIPIFEQLKKTI